MTNTVWYDRIEFQNPDNGNNFHCSVTNNPDSDVPEVVVGGNGAVALTRSDVVRLVNMFIRFLNEVPQREEIMEAQEEETSVTSMADWLEARGRLAPPEPAPDDVPPAL